MPIKSRRLAREAALRALYQTDIGKMDPREALQAALEELPITPELTQFAEDLVKGVQGHRRDLDRRISAALTDWSLDRLAGVDRTVLRLGLFEFMYCPTIPPAVTLNEAIELAKRYSTAESGKFVNGVLARLLKDTDKANWDPSALPEDAEEVVTASIEEEPVAVETIAPDTPEAEELDRVGKWMIRTPNSG